MNITTTLVDVADSDRPVGAHCTDQGWPCRSDQIARNRIRIARNPRQCRLSWRHSDPGPLTRELHRPRVATPARSGMSGQVSDIVDAILFLESSSFVTGEILHVDGGQIAGH